MNENMSASQREMARNNQVVIVGYTIYNIVLLGAYIIEVLKKSRTLLYFCIFASLSLVPLILMHVTFRRDKSSILIRLIFGVGYGIFYTFTVFTTYSPVAFVYGILVSLFVLVYSDIKYTTRMGIGLVVINILNVIYTGIQGEISAEDLPNVEIRIAFVILYFVFMLFMSKVMMRNNEDKLTQIENDKARVTAMLNQIMDISSHMSGNINMVSEKMENLEASFVNTKNSMTEVSNGTNDTAESIQSQLMKTEEIQDFVRRVEEVAAQIENGMEDAGTEVAAGKEKIDELIRQVNISDDASKKVSEELAKLMEYNGQMQSIIEIIDNITSQTSLLALNASIEAARVGEAGKGFAVVADEINQLSVETTEATGKVDSILKDIISTIVRTSEIMGSTDEIVKVSNERLEDTVKIFETMLHSSEEVIQVTHHLERELNSIIDMKEMLLSSMEHLEQMSEKSSQTTTGITTSVGEQMAGIEDIVRTLENVQKNVENGAKGLKSVLENKSG